jgi:hypothetical protein
MKLSNFLILVSSSLPHFPTSIELIRLLFFLLDLWDVPLLAFDDEAKQWVEGRFLNQKHSFPFEVTLKLSSNAKVSYLHHIFGPTVLFQVRSTPFYGAWPFVRLRVPTEVKLIDDFCPHIIASERELFECIPSYKPKDLPDRKYDQEHNTNQTEPLDFVDISRWNNTFSFSYELNFPQALTANCDRDLLGSELSPPRYRSLLGKSFESKTILPPPLPILPWTSRSSSFFTILQDLLRANSLSSLEPLLSQPMNIRDQFGKWCSGYIVELCCVASDAKARITLPIPMQGKNSELWIVIEQGSTDYSQVSLYSVLVSFEGFGALFSCQW